MDLRGMKLLEVYVDGRCRLCQRMRALVEPRDRAHAIEWLDYNEEHAAARAAPTTREQLDARIHVRRLADGVWATGYDAWLEILRLLPGWRMLAPVLSTRPMRVVGHALYEFIARNRRRFFGTVDCDDACFVHDGDVPRKMRMKKAEKKSS